MVSFNCQCIVRVCYYLLVIFCLISPNFCLSKGLSLLHTFYACTAVGGLIYLIQYYIRAKFVFLYPGKSILFILLDLFDFSIPAVSVLAAIVYAAFLKQKAFVQFYNKVVESDTFLGERYSNLKKTSLLLLTEFLSLTVVYILYLYVLTYLVHQIYGVYYEVPRENICYSLTSALFLLFICCVRAFIIIIRVIISGTNKKITHSIEGILSFTSNNQLPYFMPYFEIYPYLVQYKRCFEIIRHFNDYFGFQLLMITCASFLVLIINMYLSNLKLQGTALEAIPPYILFLRYLFNTSMYLIPLFRISGGGHSVHEEVQKAQALLAKYKARAALCINLKEENLLDDLSLLYTLIVSQRSYLNALNLFRIDKPFILKMAAAMLTYIVIAMELNS